MASAAAFKGMLVKLTLREPAGTTLIGTVAEVVPETSTLLLEHVSFPSTNHKVPQLQIAGTQIQYLELVQKSSYTSDPKLEALNPERYGRLGAQSDSNNANNDGYTEHQGNFVDPAIVAFKSHDQHQGHISGKAESKPLTQRQKRVEHHESVARKPSGNQIRANRVVHGNGEVTSSHHDGSAHIVPESDATIPILSALDKPDGAIQPPNLVRHVSVNRTRSGKSMDTDTVELKKNNRKASRKQTEGRAGKAAETTQIANPEYSVDANVDGNGDPYRGIGWRQTPILQENYATSANEATTVNGQTTKVKQGRREKKALKSGWATEEATDVQELPEFDFVSNLSRFDKKSVFEQWRYEDTVADSDRLVSINRLPKARPGTYGGKNLHFTENVLDSPHEQSGRQSVSSSASDAALDAAMPATQRAQSNAPSSRVAVRSNSGLHDELASVQSQRSRSVRPSARSTHSGSKSRPSAKSPNPQRASPPPMSPSLSQSSPTGSLHIVNSGRLCPVITPGGLAAVEEVAENEFGLPLEIMNENAGRGVADVALSILSSNDRNTIARRQTVLFLVGNHKTGARALVAARQLRSRGSKIIVCLLGLERPSLEFDKSLIKQRDILIKFGVVVRGWTDLKKYLDQGHESRTPELVVDSLLAAERPFSALQGEDQRAVSEMMAWAKGRHIMTLSVDIPSGTNGSTGIIDFPFLDNPAISTSASFPSMSASLTLSEPHSSQEVMAAPATQAKHIVCIGAPRVGLLRALQNATTFVPPTPKNPSHTPLGLSFAGTTPQSAVVANSNGATTPPNWQIWVVDIGINKAWKEYGIAGGAEGGVRFGAEWVVQVEYTESSAKTMST